MFLKFISREAKVEYGKSDIDFEQFSFFTYSRDAIYKICEQLDLGDKSEILIPDYICNVLVNVLLEFTTNIKTYHINEKLKFNSEEIESLVTDNTKLVIFVDYFGVEADVKNELIIFLQKKQIAILKDSAHSFLTLVKNNFTSAYKYDYLVSSIYKNLSLHAVAIAKGHFLNYTNFINEDIINKRRFIKLVKQLLCCLGFRTINKGIEHLIITNNQYKFLNGKNKFDSYKKRLQDIDYKQIISHRDTLALEFYEYFGDNSLFDIREIKKSSLQCFPIWCSSQKNRDNILNIMRMECIDTYTWPAFHKIAINKKLWSHILLIPLDEKALTIVKRKIENV